MLDVVQPRGLSCVASHTVYQPQLDNSGELLVVPLEQKESVPQDPILQTLMRLRIPVRIQVHPDCLGVGMIQSSNHRLAEQHSGLGPQLLIPPAEATRLRGPTNLRPSAHPQSGSGFDRHLIRQLTLTIPETLDFAHCKTARNSQGEGDQLEIDQSRPAVERPSKHPLAVHLLASCQQIRISNLRDTPARLQGPVGQAVLGIGKVVGPDQGMDCYKISFHLAGLLAVNVWEMLEVFFRRVSSLIQLMLHLVNLVGRVVRLQVIRNLGLKFLKSL
mmetsp:Transcript_25407/g.65358  ORF Transcript_25407/g.65358 Transcript_25407/m.65358 type:complete len:274 (+) Transcript_25407:634-1455(+)